MKNKYLTFLFASIIAACSIYPALGQETTASEITFTCEDNNDTPITIAKNKEGQIKTIFHWKEEALKTEKSTPLKLCNSAAKKLNEYANQEPNLSSFVLTSSEVSSLGIVCINRTNSVINDCQKIIFTLFPSEDKPSILLADETLAMIIDPNIPYKDLNPGDPVVPGYKVNLFKAK